MTHDEALLLVIAEMRMRIGQLEGEVGRLRQVIAEQAQPADEPA